MSPPEKRKRVSISTPSQQPQTQQHPLVALTPPLVPYHPHSPGHPHMVPMVPYQMCHPHAHPHYYISVASPTNALGVASNPTTSVISSPSIASTSPRYERILPKRASDANVPSPSSSPSAAPPYAYSLQPSPLSLPQHHHTAVAGTIPSLFPLPPSAQPTTADQREQARKVSHSAIERRRRERINDKIMQLKQIIPSCADQENLHKLSILQSAIDYINYLKKQVELRPSPTLLDSPTVVANIDDEEEEEEEEEAGPVVEPLKPIDIMKNNNSSTSFQHSSPPCQPDSPSLALEQNSHMKLDHLLS